MLQRLLIITLTLCSLTASAQWQQTGSKVRYVNGLGIPTKDTAAGVAADSSQILIRPADSSLYIKYKRTWVKVGAGGGGTIGGSGTINRVPKFTASTTLGNSSIVDSASAVVMTINSLGNVGIGTASPAERLSVAGNIELTTGANRYISIGSASNYYYRLQSVGDDFQIQETTTPRLTIKYPNGNVGIGYTAPAAKLSVDGTTLINTNTDNGVDKLQVSGSTLSTRYKVNTSGQSFEINGYYNTGAGFNLLIGDAGSTYTSGEANTALGRLSLDANTTGGYNVAIGFNVLSANTTGSWNVGVGSSALSTNTTGSENLAFGEQSLSLNTTGNKNAASGRFSLFENTTGSSNVAWGYDAGRRISGGGANQTSNQSAFIGEDTRASAAGNTNEMVFGHTAIGQGSNTVTLGNSSITKTFLRGNTMVNTTSDNGVDKLQVNGSISGIGFKQAYVTKTGTYTATTDDYVIDCTSGTFTVNLPALLGRTGMVLIIKNSGTGTITVDPNGAAVIDGAATYSLAVQYATIQIISDGTDWKIISKF